MVYFADKTKDLSLGHSISDNSARLLQRGEVGSQDIEEFLQQRPGSQNIRRLLLLKKIRYLKLRNLALFCVWEDAGVWAH